MNARERKTQIEKKKNICYINIDGLHSYLGKILCKSLPAYHAFTGLDYTASYTRRGKVKPFKISEKWTEYQSPFIELTGDSEIKETTLQKIEEFACVMYGKKKSTTCVITIVLWVAAGNKQSIYSLMVQRIKLPKEVRHCY